MTFEPRLTPQALIRDETGTTIRGRCLGELANPKDRASIGEWGHATIAPTANTSPKPLGMFPFTP